MFRYGSLADARDLAAAARQRRFYTDHKGSSAYSQDPQRESRYSDMHHVYSAYLSIWSSGSDPDPDSIIDLGKTFLSEHRLY